MTEQEDMKNENGGVREEYKELDSGYAPPYLVVGNGMTPLYFECSSFTILQEFA